MVILGFHRLLSRTSNEFDYNGLAELVLEVLNGPHGNYILPETFTQKSYGQIVDDALPTQRAFVCWPTDQGRAPEFSAKVTHHWDGQTIGSIHKNREHLMGVHENPIPPYPFHSDQAVIFSIFQGPRKLSPYIETLYEVDGEMANKVQFVAVDFIESTWLVDIIIAENLVRVKRGI